MIRKLALMKIYCLSKEKLMLSCAKIISAFSRILRIRWWTYSYTFTNFTWKDWFSYELPKKNNSLVAQGALHLLTARNTYRCHFTTTSPLWSKAVLGHQNIWRKHKMAPLLSYWALETTFPEDTFYLDFVTPLTKSLAKIMVKIAVH